MDSGGESLTGVVSEDNRRKGVERKWRQFPPPPYFTLKIFKYAERLKEEYSKYPYALYT